MHTPFEALITSKSFLITMTMLALAPEIPAQQAVAPPPNAPATVAWDAGQGKLALRYHGAVILDARVRAEDAAGKRWQGLQSNWNNRQPPARRRKSSSG